MRKEERVNKEKSEFQVTPKQLEFFMDVSKDYAMSLKGTPDSDDHFRILCDRMLKHEDNEIRVELPRVLMSMGFNKLVGNITEGILKMMKKGLFGEG